MKSIFLGSFRLAGSPAENEREFNVPTTEPHQRFWEFQKGQFPFGKGFRGKAPEDRGGSGCPRLSRVARPRGKAHENGMPFPIFVPPLNNLLIPQ